MNFKVPSIASAIVFVLIFLINLIKGNNFGIVLLRSFISAAVTFGLFFAMMFVFKTVLGVSSEDLQDEPDSDNDNSVGQNFDATVGDDDGAAADTAIDTNDYSDSGADTSEGDGSSDEMSDSAGAGYDDFLPGEEHSYEEEGFAEAGTSESSGNLDGDTIREKLGYDASAEDLAKAIRTIIPRDDK